MPYSRHFVVLFLALLAACLAAHAGSLEPSGPPAPTMVTLQQIYDRLSPMLTIGVAKTGQTGCWDPSGASIACATTGQDGEYQMGTAVSPRFTDNGNGTVRDNLTGLIWLKNANCFGAINWANALAAANTLESGACGLTDGSVAGNWRLPNIRELQSLLDYGHSNPALPPGYPFTDVQIYDYASSTTYALALQNAWIVNFSGGDIASNHSKTTVFRVWPMRSGQ
ncbi:MAG: DUF1566 domain-containing protein [Acidobacteriia bacterium]|nr:DUF1566 domain-containing protein [Terriglobia bacterium]